MFGRNKNEPLLDQMTLRKCLKEIDELKIALEECRVNSLSPESVQKINRAIETNTASIAYLSESLGVMMKVYSNLVAKVKVFEDELSLTGVKFKDYSN